MSNKEVSEILTTARRLGWTAIENARHYKLIPPGGLSRDCPRPVIIARTPSDRRWLQNTLAEVRRVGEHGQALASVILGAPEPYTGNGHDQELWHDPLPPVAAPAVAAATSGVTVGIEHIGPVEAEKYLGDLYDKQRLLRSPEVQKWAEEMAAGRWELLNDAIGFDSEGRLMNGQHRLHAVIKTQTTQPFIVMRGTTPAAFAAMDTGRKRTLKDWLAAAGEKNYNTLASMLGQLYRYTRTGSLAISVEPPSVSAALEFLDQHPNLRESATAAVAVNSKRAVRGFPAHIPGIFHYLFGVVDTEDREAFFDEIINGAVPGTPVAVLRDVMGARQTLPKERKPSPAACGAYFVKTWNAYTRGDDLIRLNWKAAERWPAIYDPDGRLDGLIPKPK